MNLHENVVNKWSPLLDHPDLPEIENSHRRAVTAQLLENTERSIAEQAGFAPQSLLEAAPTNAMGASSSVAGTGNVDIYDPVLISLVRRSMPNLVAYDICGVQPMTGPTGLIFAMRSRYDSQTGTEAMYNEANTGFSAPLTGAASNEEGQAGQNLGDQPAGANTSYNYQGGIATADAEALGGNTTYQFPEMAFSIEKVAVTAKSRALKAEYTMELAQDLKAIHGLDAETELANILQAEVLAEINREVVRTINLTAVTGAQHNVASSGTFDLDVDSNGRWMVEKFKGLMFQIEREANQIAKDTRRGKGNIMLCSSDVASALQMAGVLDYTPALNANNLEVDDTGKTFAGVLNGRMRVYIDPYFVGGSGNQYMTVGYKGANAFDSGLFYCPYVPLQMVRAVGENSFQPKIGFKTRYGMVANPFAEGDSAGAGRIEQNSNKYYRRVTVANLM